MTPAPGRPVTLRPLQERDLDQVEVIERTAQQHPWTRQHFSDELARACARCLVALGDDGSDRVLGYLIWWLVVDEAQIITVATAPAARRQGVAGALLDRCLSDLRAAGAASLWLEVRASNFSAQALYRARGFVVAGRRPRYYAPEGEDAVVMRLALARG